MYKALLTYCRYLSCNSNTFRTNAWSNPITTSFFSAFLLLAVSSACITNVIPSSMICFFFKKFAMVSETCRYFRNIDKLFILLNCKILENDTLCPFSRRQQDKREYKTKWEIRRTCDYVSEKNKLQEYDENWCWAEMFIDE